MKVFFGIPKVAINKDMLREKLESCEASLHDWMPRLWARLPVPYQSQRNFKNSLFLKTKSYSEREGVLKFSAEWDEIYPYLFRGEELWGARTNYAGVRMKHIGNPWLVSVENDWGVAIRISKIVFEKQGQLSSLEIPSEVLRKVLEKDSRVERRMGWREIEEGVDGILKGTLPKKTGTRHRFDKEGNPYFATFESMEHNCIISISCRNGTVSSKSLTTDEITEYYERMILPHLKLGRLLGGI